MRITPEQFDTFFRIWIGIIVCFMIFAGIRILMFQARRRNPTPRPPRKPHPGPPTAVRVGDDSTPTFGISDMSASDMSTTAGDFSSGDSGGGDSGGGWSE